MLNGVTVNVRYYTPITACSWECRAGFAIFTKRERVSSLTQQISFHMTFSTQARPPSVPKCRFVMKGTKPHLDREVKSQLVRTSVIMKSC